MSGLLGDLIGELGSVFHRNDVHLKAYLAEMDHYYG